MERPDVSVEEELFLALSRLLTGFDDLSKDQARSFLTRLCSDPSQRAELSRLLTFYDELLERHSPASIDIGDALLKSAHRLMAKRLQVLWYTGGLRISERGLDFDSNDPSPWFGALMWRAMGAHPPALSGGYFGHWRYPPEE